MDKRIPGDNPKAKNFISNPELVSEIIACKANGNVMSDKLAKMLLLMCQRYSYRSNFSGYSFREDMVSEAIVNPCQNWWKFDETRFQNAFSYFTTCIHRNFLQVLHENKHQAEIKNSYRQDKGVGHTGFDEKQGHKDYY